MCADAEARVARNRRAGQSDDHHRADRE